MDWLNINWHEMFALHISPLEIFIRGTLMYLAIFILLRIDKRQVGSMGITDLIVIVLIADAAQNGMAGDYKSITEGVLLVATIIFWNFILEMLGFKFNMFAKILHPQPVQLIKNGRMNRKNMKAELITEDELLTKLRDHGLESVKDVKLACLEGDGKISVIKLEKTVKKPEDHQN